MGKWAPNLKETKKNTYMEVKTNLSSINVGKDTTN